ncbi:Fur family transcriptional regulator [Actinomyces vulturis]|uniref:Fur family transcriptional regulator n=1 Tax=Actinomyces vulturis TaxID=1857645 RepID=UPI00082C58FA|nr:Fur family transcriptional regulator [Actinomyces vulturis]
MSSTSPSKTRSTWQRQAVADLLARTESFRSAQQIHAALDAEGTRVGLATVYRNLQSLADAGLVDQVRSDDGEVLYRHCDDDKHHHHLVCRECGTTVEIAGDAFETWVNTVSTEHGFTDVSHTVELFGLCGACSV